jgi:cytochrome c2
LDAETAGDPANFSAERWNYRRSPKYGSPHLRPDGTPGQEWMTPSSAYLSADGQAVFVGLPDMRAGVHQMRIGWGIRARDGGKVENVAYFSPWELVAFDPVREGFGDIRVDLAPRPAVASASPAARASAEEGERLSVMMGCVACHSTDGTTAGKVGPSWKGLAGSTRVLAVGAGPVRADDAYLRESILNPGAKVPKGFEKFDTGMPIYEGILNPVQVESLVLYLKTLGGNPEAVRSGTAPP